MRTEDATIHHAADEAVKHRTRAITGLLFFTLALAGGMFLLEGAVRVVFDRNGMHYGIEMWKYAQLVKRQSANAAIGHEHTPNSRARLMGVDVRTNSQGLRNPETSARPDPKIRRVLVLGDSMTFGWGVEERDTYTRVLERMLNATGRRYELINAGVGNYNSSQEVAWFIDRGLAYEPHEVILGYYINDAEPTPRLAEGWLPRYSYLYVLLSSAADALQRAIGWKPGYVEYYAGLYGDQSPGWREAQGALQQLIRTCQMHGIEFRLLLLPELHQVDERYPFRFVHERVRAIAVGQGADVVDLDGAFRGHEPRSLWVSPGDAHPNATAHRIIAEHLFAMMTSGTE
jgi:hypothetical protein